MKSRLFTPGPTPVPGHVMLRMAEPLIHHRSPEFRAVMERVNLNLGYLFQTASPVLTLTCSGTGGVEATFVSLFLTGRHGDRGERREVRGALGGDGACLRARTPWRYGRHGGRPSTPARLKDVVRAHPEARGVYLTHSETSTGTALDIRDLARVIRENSDALVCVDGISSVGALELRSDEWGWTCASPDPRRGS